MLEEELIERRRKNTRTPWETIHRKLSEKVIVGGFSIQHLSNLPTMRVCGEDPSGLGIQVSEVWSRDG